MARFGLDSDSSDEDGTVADRTVSDGSDDEETTDGDDGIPRASYGDRDMADGDSYRSGSESETAAQRQFRDPSLSYSARSQSQSVSRRRSASTSSSDDGERRFPQRSISVASSRPTAREQSAGPQAWAPQPLKLEPKRTAVMHASFFQQPVKEVPVDKELQKKGSDSPWVPKSVTLGRPEQSTAVSSVDLLLRRNPQLTSPAQARPNFATPVVDPNPFRSFRKYSRVDLPTSITAGKEGSLVDAGLMLGRSFRVGWGPQGHFVHIGSLYGSAKPSSSDALAISTFRALAQSNVCLASSSLRARMLTERLHRLSKRPRPNRLCSDNSTRPTSPSATTSPRPCRTPTSASATLPTSSTSNRQSPPKQTSGASVRRSLTRSRT